MTIRRETSITAAVAQLAARPLEQLHQALDDMATAVAAAKKAGADLVVLPECSYPAYWLGSRERYRRTMDLHGLDIESHLGTLARRYQIHIVAGVVRQAREDLYDAAVLLDDKGRLLGSHLKTFLWDAEHNWYTPGPRVQPVETGLGKIGMVICAEGRSPEVFASHAVQDAALLAMPTGWVNTADRPGQYYNPQPDFMMQARAGEFGLPILCANKFGQECAEARFCGMSMIVSGDGEVLARAAADEAALLTARVRMRSKPLVLPEAAVRRLLDRKPPVLPAADAAPLRIAMLPVDAVNLSPREIDRLREERGVQAVLDPVERSRRTAPGSREETTPQPSGRQKTDSSQRTPGPPAWPQATRPPRDGRSPSVQKLAHADAGLLTDEQAMSFAWPRTLALDGAQMLCVIGPRIDLSQLRMRAAENRVFVVGAPAEQPVVISPAGGVLASAAGKGHGPLILDLDLAEAARKLVAPQTDVWQERRCDAYCLWRHPEE